jgi:hypothetical protein
LTSVDVICAVIDRGFSPATLDVVHLPPEAVRFVVENGGGGVAEVASHSMAPALQRGERVGVQAITSELEPGEIVLIARDPSTTADGSAPFVLHRVMHVFRERGRTYVMHQGDAPGTEFGTCAREAVIARAWSRHGDARPYPSLDWLDPATRTRFRRRQRLCVWFARARRLTLVVGIHQRPLPRRLGILFRGVARALVG